MTREQFDEWLETKGARLAKSVTKQTDLLIVGENYGETKIATARKRGVPMMSAHMFGALGLLEERGPYALQQTVDASILSTLLVQLAITCEEIMTYAIATDDDNARISFHWGSLALESLLQAAWPYSTGGSTSVGEGSGGDSIGTAEDRADLEREFSILDGRFSNPPQDT